MAVTYVFPVAGSTPPSAAIMLRRHNVVIADVSLAPFETTANVIHNMGLTGSNGFPVLILTHRTAGLTFGGGGANYVDANTVSVTRDDQGATDTYRIWIWKQHTIVMG